MPKKDKYDAHKQRVGEAQREQSLHGRDIGKIPPIKNKRRRKRCERNLPLYLKTYFPNTFYLDFSPDQLEFYTDVQDVLINGGRCARGMSRGGGKTQGLSRAAGCFAPSYGHSLFTALVGAEDGAAKEMMELIRIEWETNPLLLEDFPEIAFPIRCLEGINQRAGGQLCEGKRTHIKWTDSQIVLPSVPGAQGAGAVVMGCGILGRLRGLFRVNPLTGKTERPKVFLCDDFQTDESARSDHQCAVRELVVNGALLGLGGPGTPVSGLCSSTVIRKGDTASRIFNPKLYPRWRGKVYKLVYKWPSSKKAIELWDKYLEIRAEELAAGDELHPKATAFYKKNRKAMDKGHKIAWEKRHAPHELSALQHAYGLRADNPTSFDAEYQNDPPGDDDHIEGLQVPTSDDLVLKVGKYKRGQIPNEATKLFAGIDVQGNSLWWVVVAVADDFTGWIVDRGVFPDQSRLGHYFTLAQIKDNTLQSETDAPNDEQAIHDGLETLCGQLFGRQWKTPGGEILPLERAMIDARHWTSTVRGFCQTSELAVMPAQGIGVTAKNVAWDQTKKKKGERTGHGWKMPPVARTEMIRHASIDTNTWQTTLCRRWTSAIGAAGSWHLYRAPHVMLRMLADHLCAEHPTETSGRGRKLYEWQLRVGSENHWGDAARMAAVGASIAGVLVPGEVRKITGRASKSSTQKANSKHQGNRAVQSPRKSKANSPKKSMQQRREEARVRAN